MEQKAFKFITWAQKSICKFILLFWLRCWKKPGAWRLMKTLFPEKMFSHGCGTRAVILLPWWGHVTFKSFLLIVENCVVSSVLWIFEVWGKKKKVHIIKLCQITLNLLVVLVFIRPKIMLFLLKLIVNQYFLHSVKKK